MALVAFADRQRGIDGGIGYEHIPVCNLGSILSEPPQWADNTNDTGRGECGSVRSCDRAASFLAPRTALPATFVVKSA